jgi:hypothetical protein
MKHLDKFPPNLFMMKTVMKTPGRFMSFILGFFTVAMLGMKLFPHATATICLYGLMGLLPTMVVLMIWQVVWVIKNPPPPPEQCDKCHQNLPESDDE